jgi:hypothetical protein
MKRIGDAEEKMRLFKLFEHCSIQSPFITKV